MWRRGCGAGTTTFTTFSWGGPAESAAVERNRAEFRQAAAASRIGTYSEIREYILAVSGKTRHEVRKEAIQGAKSKQYRIPFSGGLFGVAAQVATLVAHSVP